MLLKICSFLPSVWDGRAVCPTEDICLCVCVLGGIAFEVLFVLLWPPKWKSFGAPFLTTPPPPTSITNTHGGALGAGMICRFRCSATLLPILASFRHRQRFLPLSSTPGRDGGWGGGGGHGGVQTHNLPFSLSPCIKRRRREIVVCLRETEGPTRNIFH